MARPFDSPAATDCGGEMVLAGLIRKLGNCPSCLASEEPWGLGLVVLGSGGPVAQVTAPIPACPELPADLARSVLLVRIQRSCGLVSSCFLSRGWMGSRTFRLSYEWVVFSESGDEIPLCQLF